MPADVRVVKRTLYLPTIEGIKPMNNYCVLRRLSDNFNDKTDAGLYKASVLLNLNQFVDDYIDRVYEVVAVPDRLVLYNERNKTSGVGAWWDTDIEIEVGDVVWVSYPSVIDVDVIRTPQEEYFLVKYQELRLARKPDGSYKMLNGWVLYTRIEKHTESIIIDPNVRKHIKRQIGKVLKFGNANRSYHRTDKRTKKSKWLDLDGNLSVSPGDVFVKDDKSHELILENPMFAVYPEKDVYLIQRRNMVAKCL